MSTVEQRSTAHFIPPCADAPSPPVDLQLNYQSEDQLILQWERPAELSASVNVTYHVDIANITSGNITQVQRHAYSKR